MNKTQSVSCTLATIAIVVAMASASESPKDDHVHLSSPADAVEYAMEVAGFDHLSSAQNLAEAAVAQKRDVSVGIRSCSSDTGLIPTSVWEVEFHEIRIPAVKSQAIRRPESVRHFTVLLDTVQPGFVQVFSASGATSDKYAQERAMQLHAPGWNEVVSGVPTAMPRVSFLEALTYTIAGSYTDADLISAIYVTLITDNRQLKEQAMKQRLRFAKPDVDTASVWDIRTFSKTTPGENQTRSVIDATTGELLETTTR